MSRTVSPDDPVFVISVAAELVGAHPQTLRSYERAGLVVPARTPGGTRRYSKRDLDRLRRIQSLTNQGLTLTGVSMVLDLEDRLARASRPETGLVLRRSPMLPPRPCPPPNATIRKTRTPERTTHVDRI